MITYFVRLLNSTIGNVKHSERRFELKKCAPIEVAMQQEKRRIFQQHIPLTLKTAKIGMTMA